MCCIVKINRWFLYKILKKLLANNISKSNDNPEISTYNKLTNIFNRILPYGFGLYVGYSVLMCLGSKF